MQKKVYRVSAVFIALFLSRLFSTSVILVDDVQDVSVTNLNCSLYLTDRVVDTCSISIDLLANKLVIDFNFRFLVLFSDHPLYDLSSDNYLAFPALAFDLLDAI